MAFLKVPIIGSGTEDDPYRADVPAAIPRHSAHIPSDETGRPKFADAYIWVDDLAAAGFPSKIIPDVDAKTAIIVRDRLADPYKLDSTMKEIATQRPIIL